MLIDFTVANFRSIRDPVTWSLVEVAPGKSRQKGPTRKRELRTDDQISPALDVPGWDFKLLRSSCIYGANASGKSNVVRALIALLDLLAVGHEAPRFKAAQGPFRLDATSADLPSRFSFHSAMTEESGAVAVFGYDVSFLRGIVVSEVLTEERAGVTDELFARGRNPGEVAFNRYSEKLPAAVREIGAVLAPEVPLLSFIVRNLDVERVRRLRDWLHMSWLIGADQLFGTGGTVTRVWMAAAEASVSAVAAFVRDHDTMLTGLQFQHGDDGTTGRLQALHDTPTGPIGWDLSEESAGTRSLVDMAGPILLALSRGSLLVLDEFGAHLHPHITERIVALFQSSETNPRGAQLLFNTHETYLLDNERLRRDQVWFTEKHPDGHTELFPLSDFHMRKDAALGRAYLGGSLGAVPVLPRAPRRPEAA